MMKLKRQMDAQKVRTTCINQNWWDKGTNTEYSELFKMVEQFNKFKTEKKQTETLEKMAELTVLNTDFSDYYRQGYTLQDMINNVAFYFINDCTITIVNPD